MINELYGFFDSTESDIREYSAAEFAKYFADFVPNGVAELAANLQVYATGSEQAVRVRPGRGWINGYYYELSKADTDADKQLIIAAADAVNPRIDMVVLRLNASAATRAITLAIVTGVAAATPVAPALTRAGDIYELCLARVRVAANTATIAADAVTDTRDDASVCGVTTDRAQRVSYTATLTAAGWAQDAAGIYVQTVAVDGLRASDEPYVSVTYGEDTGTNIALREDWSCVSRVICASGTLTAQCFDDCPIADIPMRLEVIR